MAVRQWCGMAPSPRLHYLVVRVGCEVSVPLGCSIALVAEQRLDEAAAAVIELREVAGGRGDLLAEVTGISLGTSEVRGDEYRAEAQVIAELCRVAAPTRP